MKLKAFTAASLLAVLPLSAEAQHCHPQVRKDVSTCGNRNMAPPAEPMNDLGTLEFPVSTISSDAQTFFNQGLTLHYAFNNEQAILSFKKAAELDPSLAMAHWGIALAASTNINVVSDSYCAKLARDEIHLAQQTEKEREVKEVEKDLIKALSALYPESAAGKNDDQKKKDPKQEEEEARKRMEDYAKEMKGVYGKYPADADVATLYADSLMNLQPWKLWTDCKEVGETKTIRKVLESVLKADATREHLGANHFYIHTMEGSCEPGRAAPSAQLLRTKNEKGKLFDAGHLIHMPSHIAMRTGQYSQAAEDNALAVKADKERYAKACEDHDVTKCMPLYVGHYLSHNLYFQLAANQQLGRLKESLKLAEEVEAHTKTYVDKEPGLEHYMVATIITQARFSQWEKLLEVAQPEENLKMAQVVWRWGKTMALAATKADPKEVTAERTKYQDATKQVSEDLFWGNNKAVAYFKLMDELLAGREAEFKGEKRATAIAHYKKAMEAEDALTYDEPHAWPLTVREALGGAYLRDHQFAKAKAVFQKDLEPGKNFGNGRSLFGLWKSLEGECSQSKPSDTCQPDVKKAKEAFEKAWGGEEPVKPTVENL